MSEVANYADFEFKSNVDEQTVKDIIDARQVVYAPTGREDQHLPVYITRPQHYSGAANRVLVRMPAWSDDNGRPEGAIFDAYLAEAEGVIVASPNVPGIDYRKWRSPENQKRHKLTDRQKEDLNKGSFDSVGSDVMRATHTAVHESGIEEPEYTLSGSSMALAVSAAATRHALENGLNLRGLNWEEGVNLISRPGLQVKWDGLKPKLAGLTGEFLSANNTASEYKAQNPNMLNDANEGDLRWFWRMGHSAGANKLYVTALKAGRFYDDLGNMRDLGASEANVGVYVSRGEVSRLSPQSAYDELIRRLSESGVRHEGVVYKGHDHAYTMTVQSLVGAINRTEYAE